MSDGRGGNSSEDDDYPNYKGDGYDDEVDNAKPEPPVGVGADTTRAKSQRELAREFVQLGINPVPLRLKVKKPDGDGWQKRPRVTLETIDERFSPEQRNIGLQLGAMSPGPPEIGEGYGLVDVDLDIPEAVTASRYLLPPTKAIFGRVGKVDSHRLYYAKFHSSINKAAIQYPDQDTDPGDKAMVCEIRIGGGGKGAQTVGPGSTHPSGELVEWTRGCKCEPAIIKDEDHDAFIVAMNEVAVVAMLSRSYPPLGVRHNAILAFGGFCARSGKKQRHAELMAEALMQAAGHYNRDHIRNIGDSYEAHKNGVDVYGLKTVAELFGLSEKATKRIGMLFGYKAGEAAPVAAPSIGAVGGSGEAKPDRPDATPNNKGANYYLTAKLSKNADIALDAMVKAKLEVYQRGSGVLVEPFVDTVHQSRS
jgi:hypothetical protein